jgi:hypothetical protein
MIVAATPVSLSRVKEWFCLEPEFFVQGRALMCIISGASALGATLSAASMATSVGVGKISTEDAYAIAWGMAREATKSKCRDLIMGLKHWIVP